MQAPSPYSLRKVEEQLGWTGLGWAGQGSAHMLPHPGGVHQCHPRKPQVTITTWLKLKLLSPTDILEPRYHFL